MFSRHHSKTSKKLWEMLEKGTPRRRILDAVPKDYYPRLDEVAGRNFTVLWMDKCHDISLIRIFVDRGMNINVPINDKGDTLLHALLRRASEWDFVLAALIDHFPELDVTVRNTRGDLPLDVFRKSYQGQGDERFIHTLMIREAEALAFDPRKQTHLQKRIMQLLGHFDRDEILELIPSQITLDVRNGDDETLLLQMIENCHLSTLEKLAETPSFRQPDLSEPILEKILSQHGDNNSLPEKLLDLHGAAVVTDGVIDHFVRLKNLNMVERCVSLKARQCGEDERKALAQNVFADIVRTQDPWLAIKALALPCLKDVADINAALLDDGKTLLVRAVERGRDKEVHDLLAAGASILMPDGTGAMTRAALEKAQKSKGEKVSALVEPLFQELVRRGNYERVHDTQISCKNGVLTYIFDFYAGQVVVRDEETKNIAATPFSEFSKSGAQMLSEAADHLKELGGNTHGFDVPQGLTAGVVRKTPRIVQPGKN